MKFFLLFFLFFFSIANAQDLNASQLNAIAEHDFSDLDEIMVSRYGFHRVKAGEEHNQKIYTNNSNEAGNLMVITIIKNEKTCSNVLSIVNASTHSIIKLRNDLSLKGYRYKGKMQMSEEIVVSQFHRDNFTVSVTDKVTGTGAYQVLLTCK